MSKAAMKASVPTSVGAVYANADAVSTNVGAVSIVVVEG